MSGNRDIGTEGGNYNENIRGNYFNANSVNIYEGSKDGVSKNNAEPDRETSHIILVVARLGKADYRSISKAIQNAEEGTRILIRRGTYNEGIVIDKPLEIIGDGAREEIIIQSGDSDCILMQTDYAVVKNLTLRVRAGRKGKEFYGVDIPQGNLTLENCDITSDSLSCIAIHGSSANPTIKNCQIHDGKESGVFVWENGEGTIENCEIFANGLSGVTIREGGNPLVKNCQIHDGKDIGVSVYENGEGTIEDCDIFANEVGVTIREGGNPLVKNCQIHDGKICGIFVYGNGEGTIENCNIFANNVSGLAIIQGRNLVAKNCQIYDGKQSGIVIYKNGEGTIENCSIFSNAYSGIEIMQGGNPLVKNCKINRNKGSAIYAYDNGKGTVENCDLTKNKRGAWNIDKTSQVQRSNNITD